MQKELYNDGIFMVVNRNYAYQAFVKVEGSWKELVSCYSHQTFKKSYGGKAIRLLKKGIRSTLDKCENYITEAQRTLEYCSKLEQGIKSGLTKDLQV